jgi:Ala-tRNA(Pro) deacylase
MRTPQYLADQEVAFETVFHPPAFSAQKRAKILHVPGRNVVKSVLLAVPRGFAVAVLPAPEQVDLARVAAYMGGPVSLATEEQIADLFRDCERGTLTPFGGLYGLPTLLEESIPLEATIVFEAQQHVLAIRMACRDFVRLEQPHRFALCRQPVATRRSPRAG